MEQTFTHLISSNQRNDKKAAEAKQTLINMKTCRCKLQQTFQNIRSVNTKVTFFSDLERKCDPSDLSDCFRAFHTQAFVFPFTHRQLQLIVTKERRRGSLRIVDRMGPPLEVKKKFVRECVEIFIRAKTNQGSTSPIFT
jgi:hypothetical protein